MVLTCGFVDLNTSLSCCVYTKDFKFWGLRDVLHDQKKQQQPCAVLLLYPLGYCINVTRVKNNYPVVNVLLLLSFFFLAAKIGKSPSFYELLLNDFALSYKDTATGNKSMLM